jgi:hypothetical protein
MKYSLLATLICAALDTAGCAMHRDCDCTATPTPHAAAPASPNPAAYRVGEQLYANDFSSLADFQTELEAPGKVEARDHQLQIDVPKGCTVWLAKELSGPVLIQYEARMVKADPPGPNDRVSDLNCFWMATDPRNPNDFFNVPARTGAFATYNQLLTYYVGQGGNTNTTTRFRRYIGDAQNRPLLPEHDLTSQDALLTPDVWQTVQLVAAGPLVEYYRDGKRVFTYTDPAPYARGYFGVRTTWNHMEVRNLTIHRLETAR